MINTEHLLRYPGSKGRAVDVLLDCRPPYFDEYREPFCGGAPFLRRVDVLPLSMPRWINDKDKPLINFYRQLRDDDSFIPRFVQMAKRISGHADRTACAFEKAKRDYATNGVSYLLLRRYAVREVIRDNTTNVCTLDYSFLRNPRFLDRVGIKLGKWRESLRAVRITDGDYSSVLEEPHGNTIIWAFIDPPFWSHQNRPNGGGAAYEHLMSQEDHVQLRDRLIDLDPKRFVFLLTIDDCELTHQLYGTSDRFYVFDRPVPYGMMGSGTQRIVNELVVTNYAI